VHLVEVENDLSEELQVFETLRRGWVRNDVGKENKVQCEKLVEKLPGY